MPAAWLHRTWNSVTGKPTILAEQLLQQARDAADRASPSVARLQAHTWEGRDEREGVVLALYGKVELEAQRADIEKELLEMPGCD